MNEICCFCGCEVLVTDKDPLVLDVSSNGIDEEFRDANQSFYCHALCFEKKLNKDVPFMWFADDF